MLCPKTALPIENSLGTLGFYDASSHPVSLPQLVGLLDRPLLRLLAVEDGVHGGDI